MTLSTVVFFAVVAWFAMQFTVKRRNVWLRRGTALLPWVIMFVDDARAVKNTVREWWYTRRFHVR